MTKHLYLIQLFVPANYNNGKKIPASEFSKIKKQLTEKFGGLTAFTQSPAEGFWENKSSLSYDLIFIFEAMAKKVDRKWWRKYQKSLETVLQQKEIVIRVQEISVL